MSTSTSNTANRSGAPLADIDAVSAADRIKSMAVEDVQGAIALADNKLADDPEPRGRIRLLSARAHALCYANDFDAAARDLALAASLAQSCGMPEELGSILLVRVQPLARMGRLDEAEAAAALACEAFSVSGPPLMWGKAEVNLGIVRRMRGNAAEAILCFERAAPLLAASSPALAAVHSNRAVALLELDRFDEASGAFAEALKVLGSQGGGHAAAIVTGNIADLLARTGRVDHALIRFEEARAMFISAGAEADAARLTAEEAEALFAVGANHKCIRLMQEALPVLRSSGLAREHARGQLVFGLANLRLGNLAGASPSLCEAAETASVAGASLISAEALIGLAELGSAEGRLDESNELAARAAELLVDRPVRRGSALATQAAILLRAGRHAESLQCLDQAEKSFGQGTNAPAPLRVRVAHLRAESLRLGGDPVRALSQLRAALVTVESFRGAIRAEQIRTAYLESSQQLFLDVCRLAPDVLPTPEASELIFHTVERLRTRTLLDSVRGEVEAVVTSESGCDRSEVAELNALYASLGPTSMDGSKDIERRRERLRAIESSRESRADRRDSARLSRTSDFGYEPLALEVATGILGEGDAIVSIYADGHDLSAQVLRRGEARLCRKIVSQERVSSLCRRFQLALARSLAGLNEPSSAGLVRTLIELHSCIFDPIEEALAGCDHLRIIPFGELHGVPLHVVGAIKQRDPNLGDPRIESYLPGVSIGATLAEIARSAPRTGRVVVIGGGDRLAPEIEHEAREAAACHTGVVSLIGSDATAEASLSAIAQADLVHLACHAMYDPEFPMSSRLQLNDRWVTAREVAASIRPGATIILAGCDTGRTLPSPGEDRFGLVRGVLASRAAAVLYTAWPLHDSTARTALVEVHRGLAAHPYNYAAALPREVTKVQRRLAHEPIGIERWSNLFVSGGLL